MAGSGIQAGTGMASASAAWGRAREFVESANAELFKERGLRCRILRTEGMMRAVGCGGVVLELPPLENVVRGVKGVGGENGDVDVDEPRMRRVRALGDRIASLRFCDLPAKEDGEGWWKRKGEEEARRKDRKMYEMVMKEREEGFRNGGLEKVDEMERNVAQKIYWIVIDEVENVEI